MMRCRDVLCSLGESWMLYVKCFSWILPLSVLLVVRFIWNDPDGYVFMGYFRFFLGCFERVAGEMKIENGGLFGDFSPFFWKGWGVLRESPAVEASISMKGTRMCFRMGKCSVFLSIVGRSGSVCCKTGLDIRQWGENGRGICAEKEGILGNMWHLGARGGSGCTIPVMCAR